MQQVYIVEPFHFTHDTREPSLFLFLFCLDVSIIPLKVRYRFDVARLLHRKSWMAGQPLLNHEKCRVAKAL